MIPFPTGVEGVAGDGLYRHALWLSIAGLAGAGGLEA